MYSNVPHARCRLAQWVPHNGLNLYILFCGLFGSELKVNIVNKREYAMKEKYFQNMFAVNSLSDFGFKCNGVIAI